jgi:hypothetical protein
MTRIEHRSPLEKQRLQTGEPEEFITTSEAFVAQAVW